MGNKCNCVSTQSTDEAEDALLASGDHQTPREPPPPYQPRVYVLTEAQKIQLVTRLTLIQSLPVGHYHERRKSTEKKSEKSEKRECPICMNDYASGDPIRLLPCMHYYHLRCADDWLLRSPTCPTCMQRVDTTAATPHWRGHSRHSSSTSTSSSVSAPGSPSQHSPSPSPQSHEHTTIATVEIHHQ